MFVKLDNHVNLPLKHASNSIKRIARCSFIHVKNLYSAYSGNPLNNSHDLTEKTRVAYKTEMKGVINAALVGGRSFEMDSPKLRMFSVA